MLNTITIVEMSGAGGGGLRGRAFDRFSSLSSYLEALGTFENSRPPHIVISRNSEFSIIVYVENCLLIEQHFLLNVAQLILY